MSNKIIKIVFIIVQLLCLAYSYNMDNNGPVVDSYEIEKQLDDYIVSIGKDYESSSANCQLITHPLTSLDKLLHEKMPHYPRQTKSMFTTIESWYNRQTPRPSQMLYTIDPLGTNQIIMDDIIKRSLISANYKSFVYLPYKLFNLLNSYLNSVSTLLKLNDPLLLKAKIEKILEKFISMCPAMSIFILKDLPLTSSLPTIIQSLNLQKSNALIIFHYTLPIQKYITMSDNDYFSMDTIIFHPITPERNAELLFDRWKEYTEIYPRFLGNTVNINIDITIFNYICDPDNLLIQYDSINYGLRDPFYYVGDSLAINKFSFHPIISMCTCLIEHFHPSRSFTLSIKLYYEKEFHASIYQIYSSSNTWFPHRLSRIYNSIVPLKTLIEDDLSVGRVECSNIIPQRQYYITFIVSSVITVIITYGLFRYKRNHPSQPSSTSSTTSSSYSNYKSKYSLSYSSRNTTGTSSSSTTGSIGGGSKLQRTPPKPSTSSSSIYNRMNSTTKPKTGASSYGTDYTSSTSSYGSSSRTTKPGGTAITFDKSVFNSSSRGTAGTGRLNSRFATGGTPNKSNMSFADEY